MDWRKVWTWVKRGGVAAGAAVFAVWFVLGEGGVAESQELRQVYRAQEAELSLRAAKQRELNAYLEAVRRQDEGALELAARRYGLVGEHEYLWKIVPAPDRDLAP